MSNEIPLASRKTTTTVEKDIGRPSFPFLSLSARLALLGPRDHQRYTTCHGDVLVRLVQRGTSIYALPHLYGNNQVSGGVTGDRRNPHAHPSSRTASLHGLVATETLAHSTPRCCSSTTRDYQLSCTARGLYAGGTHLALPSLYLFSLFFFLPLHACAPPHFRGSTSVDQASLSRATVLSQAPATSRVRSRWQDPPLRSCCCSAQRIPAVLRAPCRASRGSRCAEACVPYPQRSGAPAKDSITGAESGCR
ncbi:hypothetical protein DFH06DRAFT_1488914 [Mycena polygramma]|nr:hypothetical protein DFH06DRAFT_1488914 [Mycena polygramma]